MAVNLIMVERCFQPKHGKPINMPKYRGYVVAKKGPLGRVAMRDSGKAHATRVGAIKDMRADNKRWMQKNYNEQWVKQANFEYGAVEDGKFKDGSEGNKKLLTWHDKKKNRPVKW